MHMIKRIITLLALFGWAFAALAELEVGQPAPDFTATNISGQTVRLSDYKGQIVVMETYDSRSPRTLWEYASGTMSLVQHFLATNGVVYLIIDPGTDRVTPASAKWQMGNRKMQITDWIIDGPGVPLTQLYGLTDIGKMFVINQQGALAYSGAFDDTQDLASDPRTAHNYVLRSVKELLAGKKVSIPHAPVLDPAIPATAEPEIGKRAPNFIATDIDGKMFHLSDYTGKIVVLEAYESGCLWVDAEYQSGAMQKLQGQLASSGVVWLTIDPRVLTTPAEAKRDWADRKMVITRYMIDDTNHSLARRYRIWVTPQMFVIDKEGLLAYTGAIDDVETHAGDRLTAHNYVRQAVNELLAGKKVSLPQTKPFGCALIYPGMWNATMFQPPNFNR